MEDRVERVYGPLKTLSVGGLGSCIGIEVWGGVVLSTFSRYRTEMVGCQAVRPTGVGMPNGEDRTAESMPRCEKMTQRSATMAWKTSGHQAAAGDKAHRPSLNIRPQTEHQMPGRGRRGGLRLARGGTCRVRQASLRVRPEHEHGVQLQMRGRSS